MLIAAGHDPRRPLEVFRGPVLALRIRSIGEAAGLTVEDSNRGTPILRRWRGPRGSGAASPMRQIQKSGSGVRQ